MEVVQYLQQNGLQQLQDEYSIRARRHGTHPNLVNLNYSQIDSPLNVRVVRECRSLIVDENDNWRPVSFPFLRFPNWGEGGSEVLDWSSAKVYEKLDGSICHLYWYGDRWWVSTRSVPDANTKVGEHDITFAKFVDQIWIANGMKMPLEQHRNYCFTFELTSPYNRVIVPYTGHGHGKLHLLAVRDMSTLQEEAPEPIGNQYRWSVVRSHTLTTVDEIIAACHAINPMQNEGYIVRDDRWNRIKLKSPQYVALTHMHAEFTDRRMLQLCLSNEASEFLQYFPQYTDLYNTINNKVLALIAELEEVWERSKHITNQKEFAIAIKNSSLPSALFTKRSHEPQKSIRQILQGNITINSLERLLLGTGKPGGYFK